MLHALSLITMVHLGSPRAGNPELCWGDGWGQSERPFPHTGRVGGGGVHWDILQTTFWWVRSSLEFLPCPTALLPWWCFKSWIEQEPLLALPMSSTGGQITPLFVFLALAVPLQLFL